MTVSEEWKHSNSKHFNFFSFRATADIPIKAIQEFTKAQNTFLRNVAEISLYNISKLDWKLPGKMGTIKELLMNAKHPSTKEPLCLSIERTSTEDKHFIIVKRSHRTYVKDWLTKIADGLYNLGQFEWVNYTGNDIRFRFTFLE